MLVSHKNYGVAGTSHRDGAGAASEEQRLLWLAAALVVCLCLCINFALRCAVKRGGSKAAAPQDAASQDASDTADAAAGTSRPRALGGRRGLRKKRAHTRLPSEDVEGAVRLEAERHEQEDDESEGASEDEQVAEELSNQMVRAANGKPGAASPLARAPPLGELELHAQMC